MSVEVIDFVEDKEWIKEIFSDMSSVEHLMQDGPEEYEEAESNYVETYSFLWDTIAINFIVNHFYLENSQFSVTRYNPSLGKVRLTIQAFFHIRDFTVFIFDKTADVGEFSISEDDIKYSGLPHYTDRTGNFEKFMDDFVSTCLSLPDKLEIHPQTFISQDIQTLERQIQALTNKKQELLHHINTLTADIEEKKSKLEDTKFISFYDVDQISQDDHKQPSTLDSELISPTNSQKINTITIESFTIQEFDGYVKILAYYEADSKEFRIMNCDEEQQLRTEIFNQDQYAIRRIFLDLLDTKYSNDKVRYVLVRGVDIDILPPVWSQHHTMT